MTLANVLATMLGPHPQDPVLRAERAATMLATPGGRALSALVEAALAAREADRKAYAVCDDIDVWERALGVSVRADDTLYAAVDAYLALEKP